MAPGRVELDGEDVSARIREPDVTAVASRVSVHPGVRAAMVDRQRELVAEGGWVAEGRDIGTVVCPESPLKVFLTASEEERAEPPGRAERPRSRPRSSPSSASATPATASASTAPCAPPTDAVEVETTGLAVDEVVERIAALAAERG